MPLSATRMIPTGWSQHHSRLVSTSMNATVTVGNPIGEADYDSGTDDTTQDWTTEYEGPARIQAMNDAQVSLVVGQPLSGRTYLVQLEFDAEGIAPGMRVKVATAVNDADLVGQDLWVVDPQLGSERFTRDVICSDNQTDVPSDAV